MSLPALKPQTTRVEIDASNKSGHEEIKFSDVYIFAQAPPLNYVIKRTYGLEKEEYPNIPRFSGPPFGLVLGVYSKVEKIQFDPYKIFLELPGKSSILPIQVYRTNLSSWMDGCLSTFNPVNNRWEEGLSPEPKGKIFSIGSEINEHQKKLNYTCFTLIYPVNTPNPDEIYSLRFGSGRIPNKSEQVIYFNPATVKYWQPPLN